MSVRGGTSRTGGTAPSRLDTVLRAGLSHLSRLTLDTDAGEKRERDGGPSGRNELLEETMKEEEKRQTAAMRPKFCMLLSGKEAVYGSDGELIRNDGPMPAPSRADIASAFSTFQTRCFANRVPAPWDEANEIFDGAINQNKKSIGILYRENPSFVSSGGAGPSNDRFEILAAVTLYDTDVRRPLDWICEMVPLCEKIFYEEDGVHVDSLGVTLTSTQATTPIAIAVSKGKLEQQMKILDLLQAATPDAIRVRTAIGDLQYGEEDIPEVKGTVADDDEDIEKEKDEFDELDYDEALGAMEREMARKEEQQLRPMSAVRDDREESGNTPRYAKPFELQGMQAPSPSPSPPPSLSGSDDSGSARDLTFYIDYVCAARKKGDNQECKGEDGTPLGDVETSVPIFPGAGKLLINELTKWIENVFVKPAARHIALHQDSMFLKQTLGKPIDEEQLYMQALVNLRNITWYRLISMDDAQGFWGGKMNFVKYYDGAGQLVPKNNADMFFRWVNPYSIAEPGRVRLMPQVEHISPLLQAVDPCDGLRKMEAAKALSVARALAAARAAKNAVAALRR